jgi:hypothetical protein
MLWIGCALFDVTEFPVPGLWRLASFAVDSDLVQRFLNFSEAPADINLPAQSVKAHFPVFNREVANRKPGLTERPLWDKDHTATNDLFWPFSAGRNCGAL